MGTHPASFSGIFQPQLEDARFVLLGVPYDAGSSFRPGARLGPGQIRTMATSLGPTTERGANLRGLAARDDGDLTLPTRIEEAEATIEAAVGGIVDGGAVPLLLGGEHGVTVPAFRAVQARHPHVRYLVLDAHPDLYPAYEGDPFSHACVSHRIAALPGMHGRITQVGIRATNPEQQTAADQTGVRTVGAWEVDAFDPITESGPTYLSVDIDVLDPAHAPGCGNPVPGGLSTRALIDLINRLDQVGIVAVDVVEVNPLLDPAGVTALAAVRVITEVLGVMTGSAGP